MSIRLYGVDLFAGLGGFTLAMEQNGIRNKFSCEVKESARFAYSLNFGAVPFHDIKLVHPSQIPDHNILTAGWPCQPFSNLGVSKKISLNQPHGFLDRKYGNLFFNLANIIEKKQPDAFLLENVPGLKGHDGGKTFQVVRETLLALGYTLHSERINARYYVPQNRDRMYIIGFREPAGMEIFNKVFAEHFQATFESFNKTELKSGPGLKDILESEIDEKYYKEKNWVRWFKRNEEKLIKRRYCYINPPIAGALLRRMYVSWQGTYILDKIGYRQLTPRECARLMGLPDSFELPAADMISYELLGNSVVIPVVSRLISAIKAGLLRISEAG